MLRRLALALLLCAPLAAAADPITITVALAPYIGGTMAAFVASYGAYIVAGALAVSQMVSARRKARQAEARRRAQYNASLQDRSVSALSTTPPWRVIYGECVTGGDIVAILTSDQVGYSAKGSPRTRPDGYKHLVIVLAAHEVEQIGEVFIDGVPLGPLDAGGWVQPGSEFYVDGKDIARIVAFTGSTTAIAPVQEILSAVNDAGAAVTVTGVGTTTLTGPAGVHVTVTYRVRGGEPTVRCSRHAGLLGDPGDAYLQTEVPDKWTAEHLLRGCAYIVLTLDLEQQRFQGGPPGITASVKGRRLYDPRKDSTRGGSGAHRLANTATWQWSANPALIVRDWLCSPWGYECDPLEDIDDAYTIAAANACDVPIDIGEAPADGGTRVPLMAPTYTCNGVITTDGSRESQLEDLCESMVGAAVYGAQWQILAGAWTAPVGALTDDDLHGQIDIVQAGAAMDTLFNGVRGSYIPASKASPSDFAPYSNPVFVTADGRELWTNIDLPFTDGKQRAANIARIITERARSGHVIRFPAKLPAWRYRVGERITVTSAEYGLDAKTYRITDWQFGLDAPVTLTLEEDAAEIWDLADAVVADPTPNTTLPSPWVVSPLEGLAAASGTEHLQLQADGTIVSRVWVTWNAITDAYVMSGGRVRVRWLDATSGEWTQPIETSGDATGVYLIGVRDRAAIAIEASAVNALGVSGPARIITHFVVGKSAPPADVAGLTATIVQGGVLVTWTPCPDIDYLQTRLRLGSGWGAYSVEYLVSGRQLLIPWLPLGSYAVHARHEDRSHNVSAGVASKAFVVDASAQVQWASVAGRPKLFRVAATGFSAASPPIGAGLYNGETGVALIGAGRSYTFARIRRSDGVVTYWNGYDVFANGTDPGNTFGYGRGPAALAADLNATGSDSIAVVWTADEPKNLRTADGLGAAMLRCGASRAVFGSPQFKDRSAYVLIGIGGCGEGNGFEAYQGAVDNDVNAWVDVSFQLASGQLLVTGMGATPRTLADYSYVGDLDATRGATFGVDISGQAQTSDIALNAATVVAQQFVSGPVTLTKRPYPGPYGDVLTTITYTATEACTVQLTAAAIITQTTVLSQFGTFADIFDTGSLVYVYPGDAEIVRNRSTTDSGEHFGFFSRLRSFAMAAGETKTFSVQAETPYGTRADEGSTVRSIAFRLEVIKR